MSLFAQIEKDFLEAYKTRAEEKVSLLRLLKAALKNEMIELKKSELADEEVIKILKREVKKHLDSIELFSKGNREELAAKEKAELAIIKTYLPAELSEVEIKAAVLEIIQELGGASGVQFGQVMGLAMKKLGSSADGTLVSKVVKETLNNL
jgi:uncharacterized protein